MVAEHWCNIHDIEGRKVYQNIHIEFWHAEHRGQRQIFDQRPKIDIYSVYVKLYRYI